MKTETDDERLSDAEWLLKHTPGNEPGDIIFSYITNDWLVPRGGQTGLFSVPRHVVNERDLGQLRSILRHHGLTDPTETPKPDPSIAGLALAADDDDDTTDAARYASMARPCALHEPRSVARRGTASDGSTYDIVIGGIMVPCRKGDSALDIASRACEMVNAFTDLPVTLTHDENGAVTQHLKSVGSYRREWINDLDHTRETMHTALMAGSSPHRPDDHGPCRCQLCDACGAGPWETSEANRWLERRGREHAGMANGLWAVVSGKRTTKDAAEDKIRKLREHVRKEAGR